VPLERIVSLRRFDRAFDKLPRDIKKRFSKQIELFIEDPFYPSLKTERIKGGVYASRVTDFYRFTWEFGEEGSTVVLRNIGKHDPTLKDG
jgi:mRNA-degrading endonuclease RelE of RelBE toxin-antitoxin system